ncbi:MAG: 2-oxoacid:ferredoxin oxidoreductase subunit gamma [Nitrososphaerota archaeon]|nr:2-oxoacid:ferredoxin oxidoreductase subunit gamma [Nitrososphaerales archaeon]MDW8044407.1 2-oxoacid:ferredoxin oxidoreductase subunit gamma [Nitrososphaerota archaeon]
MKWEVRFAGFGGQGIILSGYILGKAASIYDKKNAVLTQSYGPEARGGACVADVIISDERIGYPKIDAPDVLVAMSQAAYHTYAKSVKNDGLILIDSDLVKAQEVKNLYSVPATRIAEELGRRMVANILMLGFFTAVTRIVSYDAMRQSILTSVPKGTEELNIRAFEKGYEYGTTIFKKV